MKITDFIGAWKGNDLDECLESVYRNRGLIMNEFIVDDLQEKNRQLANMCQKLDIKNKQLSETIEQLRAENANIQSTLNAEIKEINIGKDVALSANLDFYKENKQLKAENERLKFITENLKREIELRDDFAIKRLETIGQVRAENAQLKAQLPNSDKCQKCGADIYCHDCMAETIYEATKRIGWGKNENCDKVSQDEHCGVSGAKLSKEDIFCKCNAILYEFGKQLPICCLKCNKPIDYSQYERKPKCARCKDLKGYYVSENNGKITINETRAQYINCPDCSPERKPHKCPICDGGGKQKFDGVIGYGLHMLNPNYSTDALGNIYKNCKSCNGAGIVWEAK